MSQAFGDLFFVSQVPFLNGGQSSNTLPKELQTYERNDLPQVTHHFQMSFFIFISIWNDDLAAGLG